MFFLSRPPVCVHFVDLLGRDSCIKQMVLQVKSFLSYSVHRDDVSCIYTAVAWLFSVVFII